MSDMANRSSHSGQDDLVLDISGDRDRIRDYGIWRSDFHVADRDRVEL